MYVGSRSQQSRHPALGHVPTTDHDDASTGQSQARWVAQLLLHASIIAAGHLGHVALGHGAD